VLCTVQRSFPPGSKLGTVYDFVDSLESTNYWKYSLVGWVCVCLCVYVRVSVFVCVCVYIYKFTPCGCILFVGQKVGACLNVR